MKNHSLSPPSKNSRKWTAWPNQAVFPCLKIHGLTTICKPYSSKILLHFQHRSFIIKYNTRYYWTVTNFKEKWGISYERKNRSSCIRPPSTWYHTSWAENRHTSCSERQSAFSPKTYTGYAPSYWNNALFVHHYLLLSFIIHN